MTARSAGETTRGVKQVNELSINRQPPLSFFALTALLIVAHAERAAPFLLKSRDGLVSRSP